MFFVMQFDYKSLLAMLHSYRRILCDGMHLSNLRTCLILLNVLRPLFLRAHSWLNWVDEDDDEDEVGLN